MTMKKILVLMFAVLLAAPAFSQIKFGVKAGASTDFTFTNQTITDAASNTNVVINNAKNAEWGLQGGVFVRASLLGVYVQPELLLATATNSITYNGIVDGTDVNDIKNQKFTKVNIPVLVGFKVGFLRVNAGPAASFLIGDPKELLDGETYKKATFGYQAGIGVDILKKLTIDARYEGNLNQFGNEVTIGGETFKLDDRTGALIISVGLIF
jgi:hypothetical protein